MAFGKRALIGFALDLTDTWIPEQRERFLHDWQDNEFIAQINQGQKRSYEEMIDDEPQTGGGVDEMSDDETSDESNFFTVDRVKQVNVKKFKTTGMDYHIRLTNTFADLELSEFHSQLHEIFQRMLNEVIDGVPAHDQVRFVLHSSQLEKPTSFPFMPREHRSTRWGGWRGGRPHSLTRNIN